MTIKFPARDIERLQTVWRDIPARLFISEAETKREAMTRPPYLPSDGPNKQNSEKEKP
jgi:hypothetical protein